MARDTAYRLIQHADAANKLSEKSDILPARWRVRKHHVT
jgi:hypothetical protein